MLASQARRRGFESHHPLHRYNLTFEARLMQGFKSFEQIEAFCIEQGGTPELCSSLEGRCREVGVTTPDECFLVLSIATTTALPASSLSEEEMEERRVKM